MDTQIEQVLRRDSALGHVLDRGLGTEYDLTQTSGDTAMSLVWAYADANRLTVAYTIAGRMGEPRASRMMPAIKLAAGNGEVFGLSPLYGAGSPAPADEGRSTYQYSFSMSGVAPLDGKLSPRLSVSVDDRSFGFDFILPLKSDQWVFDSAQTASDQGIDVTLQRVLVTPSQVAVGVCFRAPDPLWRWTSAPHLTVGGVPVDGGVTVRPDTPPDNDFTCETLLYNAAVTNTNGPWRLEIRELIGFAPGGSGQQRIAGSWRFDFTLPPPRA